MPHNTYDLIIIGSGPGGAEAAYFAAENGMHCAVIERDALGGTCLNRGCIPTKTLLHTSALYRELRTEPRAGIITDGLQLDFPALMARKDAVVATLTDGIAARMKRLNIDVYHGTATITSPDTVRVETAGEEDRVLTAQRILIATGSAPALPPVPGLDASDPRIMTSDDILSIKELPKSLTIIGGGVIGVEFASVFNDLGVSVTVIEALDRLLANMDKEFGVSMKGTLKKRGVNICTGAMVNEVIVGKEQVKTVFSTGDKTEEISSDILLVATGRRGVIDGLFADNISITTDIGCIVTDANHETNVKGIYAIGDVTGGIQLAHAAAAAGINAVCHMLGKVPVKREDICPACVYTDPEIASVGLTKDEAAKQGRNVTDTKYLMGANGKSALSGAGRGFVRLVYETDTGILLGAQMMCEHATDMISQITHAIVHRQTMRDLCLPVFPHPTFSEAISECTVAKIPDFL